MKTIAIALVAIICAQIFCMPVQQTLAFPRGSFPLSEISNFKSEIVTDVPDSDTFLQAATHLPRPARDNSGRVADLLARMTLEEKVGQMTQLAIGFISTGAGDDIQLDQSEARESNREVWCRIDSERQGPGAHR